MGSVPHKSEEATPTKEEYKPQQQRKYQIINKYNCKIKTSIFLRTRFKNSDYHSASKLFPPASTTQPRGS